MKHLPTHALVLSLLGGAWLAWPASAQGDAETVNRLVREGRDNSQVWAYLEHLSKVIGPRLTGSSRAMQANAWTRDAMIDAGVDHAWLDKWGEIPVGFDRGPSRAGMLEPVERDFEFTTRAWAAGTDGPWRGPVIKEPGSLEDLEAIRDRLEGAWVLAKGRARGRRRGVVPEGTEPALREEIAKALAEAGIVGRLESRRGDLVTTGGLRGWREMEYESLPDEVTVYVRRSDYDAMNSRLADGENVVVEVDLKHHFVPGPIPVFNTIGEIRGTEWPEQVVIVSAHLDTWDGPGSEGAQDNGTGSAVTIEAARILATVGVRPRRTIRFILWTGEEQGLLGSRAYVEGLSEEERANISAVFVDDGGTNYQGGLVCVESMAPMLAAATAPVTAAFPDLPVEIRPRERMPRGGGSDHASFNRAGIPGFFWIEAGVGGAEGKNYRFVHHTQHDTMRYALEAYLVQSATCTAVTAYNLAMADTLLPREVREEEIPEETERAPSADGTPWTIVSGPLSGAWEAELTGEEAPPDATFTLSLETADDGRVRGHIASRIGEGDFSDGRYDRASGTLRFTFDSSMGRLSYLAELKGDELTGTVSVEDQFSFPFRATRVAETGEPAAVPAAEATTDATGL